MTPIRSAVYLPNDTEDATHVVVFVLYATIPLIAANVFYHIINQITNAPPSL